MHIDFKKLEAAGWEIGLDETRGVLDIYPRHQNELGQKLGKLLDDYTDLTGLEAEQVGMETLRRIQQFQLLKLFD